MNKKFNMKDIIIKFVLITFAAILYAGGIAIFLDPNSLAPGGVTGIAIIISKLTGLQTGTLILMINIPILLFGWWKFGTKFMLSTIYVTFFSSFVINLLNANFVNVYGVVTKDLLLSGVAGGALVATGIAIIFRQGGTTGGTDVIVKALRQKYKHIKSGTIFAVTDAIIIVSSAFIFKNIEVALYATISVVVSNFVLNKILYGGDSAKLLYIISDCYKPIAHRIMDELDIGVTYLQAEGAYTGKDKKIVMCICRNYNYSKIRDIIKEEDQEAFFIVSSANEVFGDGYKSHTMVEL